MIVSDNKFVENQLKNLSALPPESEQKFKSLHKMERIFSAAGGALISYAASKALNKDKDNNWFHIAMAIFGGALILRGLKKDKQHEESE